MLSIISKSCRVCLSGYSTRTGIGLSIIELMGSAASGMLSDVLRRKAMTCRCLLIYYRYMRVEPVSFGKEHKEMLVHAKMLLEQGYIAINPVFDKLITSLRTAIAEENILDKESTSYADIFDAYRLALNHYQFAARKI